MLAVVPGGRGGDGGGVGGSGGRATHAGWRRAPSAKPANGAAAKKQPKAGPTAEEKAAAAAARAEKAAQQAAQQAGKAASKIEAKIHAQLVKGNEDKQKKAAKALSAEKGTLAKHETALEAAETKARAAGISEEDVKRAIASTTGGKKGGKGGKAKPPTPSVAVSAGKSVADILKEPGCPSDQLPPRARVRGRSGRSPQAHGVEEGGGADQGED